MRVHPLQNELVILFVDVPHKLGQAVNPNQANGKVVSVVEEKNAAGQVDVAERHFILQLLIRVLASRKAEIFRYKKFTK